jgi:glycosyltransferase involved in cell wall biosynthesis
VRVLLVNSERSLRGGEHQTVALARGLRERGCDVYLCVRKGSQIIGHVTPHFPVATAPFESIPLMTPHVLRRCIAAWRPDILHAQTSRAHTHLRFVRFLLGNPPPVVVSRRVAFPVSGGPVGWLKYRTGVAHYIPISDAAAGTLRAAGVPADRMTIVPSGIDVARFAAARGDEALLARWGITPDEFIIGTVAAFEESKGYLVLLEAALHVLRRHPECRFVCLGSGGGEEWLRGVVARAGLGAASVVSSLDVPLETILPLMHLFALPSLREGLSTALLAALAAGIPVVASDTGGIPEVLGSDYGLLVPPGDARALARGIIDLIEDERKRRELASRGHTRALQYDIGRTIDGTLGVYRAVLAGE